MRIITRDGSEESIDFNKIVQRISKACDYCKTDKSIIDPDVISLKVINTIRDNIRTEELDEETARICMNLSMDHPDWGLLGSRIIVNNHQKKTNWTFSECISRLYYNYDMESNHAPLIAKNIYNTVSGDTVFWDTIVIPERDFNLDFFGFKTLEKTYLLRNSDNIILETPQYMWMRVALGIWCPQIGEKVSTDWISKVKNTYDMLSLKLATHATPTLFNAGTPRPAMSSCFLLGTEDSIEGIYKTITDTAKISKWAGGIGVHISNIRAKNSYIKGTGGKTDGIVPMLKVYNSTARYVNQCFTPETLIYTKRGPVEIEKVKDSDWVITSSGDFKKVCGVFCSEISKSIRCIKALNTNENIRCTDVHQIQVIRTRANLQDVVHNMKDVHNLVISGELVREYIPALEIQEGDLMCFPIPKFESEYILSNYEYLNVIEGFNHYGSNINKTAMLSLPELQDIFEMLLETNLRDMSREQPFNSAVKTLPCSITVKNKKSHDMLRFMLMRFGQLGLGNVNSGVWETNLPKTKFMNGLTACGIQEYSGFFEYDGWMYTPVISNIPMEYTGKVYDLNIEENHNYLTSCGLVHNSGKRLGSFAMYMEPWHADIFDFLKSMRKHGDEDSLSRDLFYAMWIPDLFMEKVKNEQEWHLMCPSQSPGLADAYGDEFVSLYNSYVKDGKFRKKVKAQDVWNEIIKSQIEAGIPYMCYKDAFNKKSNQMNIGTIKSSNLCTEIALYSDDKEYAVCNLGSVRLNTLMIPRNKPTGVLRVYTKSDCRWCDLVKVFLEQHNIKFEVYHMNTPNEQNEFMEKYSVSTFPQIFDGDLLVGGFDRCVSHFRLELDQIGLRHTVHTLVENIDRIVDINYYPTEECRKSNLSTRPLGIGVQNLAELFAMMWVPFESQEARDINKHIFEDIYFYAVEKSIELAVEKGSYSRFEGSPISKGLFQFDLCGITPYRNWDNLRSKVKKHGIRNSVLLALMPTASTAQILGSTESFEPFNSCMYLRRTLGGEFLVTNGFLMRILIDLGLWNKEMKQRIMYNRGSIQNIKTIPQYVKNMYKTVWEIKKTHILDMSVDRQSFICQSQSLNHFVDDASPQMLTNIHMYGWKNGLKTGSYYIRTRPAANAQSFTIDPELETKFKNESKEPEETCLSCGS